MKKNWKTVKEKQFFYYKTTAIILSAVVIISFAGVSFLLNYLTDDREKIENLEKQIINLEENLDVKNLTYENLKRTVALLKLGNRTSLHNPTLTEVKEFLANDTTDKKNFSAKFYSCNHYSKDVNNNAENHGIRCGFVIVNPDGYSHALVAFNTSDQGLVFFEPQNDREVNLTKGESYWINCIPPIEKITDFKVNNWIIYW
jgi:hypothetical protein